MRPYLDPGSSGVSFVKNLSRTIMKDFRIEQNLRPFEDPLFSPGASG